MLGMLSIFPDLLAFGLFAPFIIRIALAIYALSFAISTGKKASRQKDFSIYLWIRINLASIGGILVFLGIFTQIGALFLGAWAALEAFRNKEARAIYLLALAMALSLVFSGAGFIAFDFPL